MNVAITGASGQMGSSLLETIENTEHNISFCCDKEEKKDARCEIRPDSMFYDMLRKHEPDVIIDFTAPKATMKYLEAAKQTETPLVIGTTGFSEAQKQVIEQAANTIPIVKATNFSASMAVMKKIVKQACSSLDSYDVEITETHHRRKNDAPSGTAQSLISAVEEATESRNKEHGRKGNSPRSDDEIGVHSRRAGDIRGSHEVLIAGDNEVLEISHRSESRKVFSAGAIRAGEWVLKAGPGIHSFEKVLDNT
jgi:4-hydroxy-tetrahydrodipicolinate reductase